MDQQILSSTQSKYKNAALGILLMAIGIFWAYFFMYRPLQVALRTGHIEFFPKIVGLAPMCMYLGVMVLTTDVLNGQLRVSKPNGTRVFTKKGKWLVAGGIATVIVVLGAWTHYLHTLGFEGKF